MNLNEKTNEFDVNEYNIDSGFTKMEKINIFMAIKYMLEGQSINIEGYNLVIHDKQICFLAQKINGDKKEPYLLGLDKEFGDLIKKFANIDEEQKMKIINSMIKEQYKKKEFGEIKNEFK